MATQLANVFQEGMIHHTWVANAEKHPLVGKLVVGADAKKWQQYNPISSLVTVIHYIKIHSFVFLCDNSE